MVSDGCKALRPHTPPPGMKHSPGDHWAASSVLAPVEGPADQKNQVFNVSTFFHCNLRLLHSFSHHPSYFMLTKYDSILFKLQPRPL